MIRARACPALVVSAPFLFVSRIDERSTTAHGGPPQVSAERSYAVLLLDGAYIRGEMLPSLAQHHFQSTAAGFDYELAVVPTSGSGSLYQSIAGFAPKADAKVDASADLFHLRVQDFGPLAAEISRFAFFTAAAATLTAAGAGASGDATARTKRSSATSPPRR